MTDVRAAEGSNAPEKNDFSATLNLPKTVFPMRANLPAREPGWVARWLEEDIYGKLRAQRQGAEKFILHLGPPYANGNMHMGHVLTYVLKDFVVRSKFMAGMDSPYVPGWDCHGLPIEWKVEQDLRAEGKTKRDVSKAELRKRCRAYAAHWVGVQKADWQRFGALGDWDRPYLTMNFANEAGIVRELGKLVQRGFVEKNLRSTLWSWAEETAMAEAEVEYDERHESTAVYVALPLVRNSEFGIRNSGVAAPDEFLVIWTTTPWTLPANRAVAVKVDEEYVCVNHGGKKLWVVHALLPAFAKALDTALVPEEMIKGAAMVGWRFEHPLYAGVVQPVVEGFHVTTDAGTGLVHIAPAHGAEDFIIGKDFGLPLECPVDGAGKYEDWVEDQLAADSPLKGNLAGRLIWDCKDDILAALGDKLLKAEKVVHKYPISWRSKKPLIFRTTKQWFVALDKPIEALGGKTLREASLDRIYGRGVHGVNWVPEYGMNRIGSMIENRPDWCISRQRAWGVPITVMTVKEDASRNSEFGIRNSEVVREGLVVDPAVWGHIAGLFEKEGVDAWDSRLGGREEELFPAGWLEKHGAKASDFEYATDILDVWFDSGTTHAHVLRADSGPGGRFERKDGKRPADLYQEGSDQHRGWFHSSLLTSVANYGDAPYESVVTSGFVVDGEGRKFSKSLGNGVEPKQLLDRYGMDIIRLWVASADYSEDVRYSPAIMDSMADAYRRFRNTLRWLLGNSGPEDLRISGSEELPELERYMLHRLGKVLADVRGYYDSYQFNRGYRALYEFCGTELSNFYFDVRKDVLYCDAADSPTRKACQAVLVTIFRGLVTHLAPLMPFTTDEAWRCRYGEGACVHLETFEEMPEFGTRNSEFEVRWEKLMALRDSVNVELEKLRAAGGLGANAEAAVELDTELPAELVREVCGVSAVRQGKELKVAKHSGHKCPRCWRYYDNLTSTGVCLRCEEALQQRGDV